MIEGSGFRDEVELRSDKGIIEVMVVGAVTILGAVADEEALFVSDVLIETAGVVPILGDFGRTGVLIVRQAQWITRSFLSAGVIGENGRAHLIERLVGILLPGNGVCWKRPPAAATPRCGIVDRILSATGF